MKTSIYRQHAGLVYAVADPIDRGRADESVDSQVSVDFTRQRRAQPVAFLLPSTQKWLEGLPRRVQPHVLCDYYPRVANSLAAVWEDTEGLRAYFDGLYIDRRGGRRDGYGQTGCPRLDRVGGIGSGRKNDGRPRPTRRWETSPRFSRSPPRPGSTAFIPARGCCPFSPSASS